MSTAPLGKWSPEQQQRLESHGVTRSVDIHCHCLPGLDDGPESMDDALALCQAIVVDGITSVIATPHQLGRYDRTNSAAKIREAVRELSVQLAAHGIPLEIYPGGDVRVDERLPRLLDAGEVATIAGAGGHLLLELPHELFVDPVPMIEVLRERSVQAILTHPERHYYLHGSLDWAHHWIREGAVLQVTAGSLLGDFGRRVHEFTWHLVQAGLIAIVATDAHDVVRRPPRLTAALNALEQRIGSDLARRLAIDNPLCVLQGTLIESP